jgi:hypothetical protein
MSQTWKDSTRKSAHRMALEVTRNNNDTYEILFNGEIVGSCTPEAWLDEELCAKRGFCGEELLSIKRQLQEFGRAVIVL